MPWRRDRLPTMVFLGFPGGSDSKGSIVIQLWSLSWEDPLEKEMANHSRSLAWKIPWTKEPGGLQSMGSQGRSQTRPKWLSTNACTQSNSPTRASSLTAHILYSKKTVPICGTDYVNQPTLQWTSCKSYLGFSLAILYKNEFWTLRVKPQILNFPGQFRCERFCL